MKKHKLILLIPALTFSAVLLMISKDYKETQKQKDETEIKEETAKNKKVNKLIFYYDTTKYRIEGTPEESKRQLDSILKNQK